VHRLVWHQEGNRAEEWVSAAVQADFRVNSHYGLTSFTFRPAPSPDVIMTKRRWFRYDEPPDEVEWRLAPSVCRIRPGAKTVDADMILTICRISHDVA
jgi:hypothetical protein